MCERVAIVTGSSRGIGRAIALELARQGCRVVVNCRVAMEAAEAVAEEIRTAGGEALVFAADVSRGVEVQRLMDATVEHFERIDVLVNNAGMLMDNYLAYMTEDQWDTALAVNLRSVFLCTKHASKVMLRQKSGRIVNMTSVAGLTGDMLRTNYSAAKAGIVGFTKAAARELAPRGITVNAVAPGYIATDMIRGTNAAKMAQLLSKIPMQRVGSPEDVAGVVAFLASDEAAYITGQVLKVDGGLHM